MPRFLLLPGLDGTGRLLDEFRDALAALGTVECVHYPGDQAWGYAELLRHVQAGWCIDADTVVVAESFAGPLAITLAAQASPAPRALVLCATFASSPLPWLRPLRGLVAWLPLQWRPMFLLNAVLLGRWATPRWTRRLRAVLDEIAVPVVRTRLYAALTADATSALVAVRCPLLYLQAAADRLVRPACARSIAEHNLLVELAEIDAPHFLLQVAPHPARAAIARFLDEHVDTSCVGQQFPSAH